MSITFEDEARAIITGLNNKDTAPLVPLLCLVGADSRMFLTSERFQYENIDALDVLQQDLVTMCLPVYTAGDYVSKMLLVFPAVIADTAGIDGVPMLEDPEAGEERLVIVSSSRGGELCSRAYPIRRNQGRHKRIRIMADEGYPVDRESMYPMVEMLEEAWKAAELASSMEGENVVASLSLRGAGIQLTEVFPHITAHYSEMPHDLVVKMLEEEGRLNL
jgi:hypothetical protein